MYYGCLGVALSESGTDDDMLLRKGGPFVASAPDGPIGPGVALVSGGDPPFEYLI